jgi:glyoxylase-like metal-dependent hydrolase (beta-lactamase superfamily II)
MSRCEVHVLRAGACVHPEAMVRQGASLCPATFPALTGLILHPQAGPVLFDTGYDPAFVTATRPFPERLYRWTTPMTLAPGEAVSEQIGRLGLKPDDIKTVVLSHFHGDHVAGLHAFPKARLFCARAGIEDLRRRSRFGQVRRGLLAGLVPDDCEARATYFEDRPRVALPRDYAPFDSGADLLGDGSLIAVELPGHCPGHWGLAVRDAWDRRVFFIGDAAWSSRSVRDNVPPPRFTTALLGQTAPYRRTLAELHQLWARNPDIRLTPSHCQEVATAAGLSDGA